MKLLTRHRPGLLCISTCVPIIRKLVRLEEESKIESMCIYTCTCGVAPLRHKLLNINVSVSDFASSRGFGLGGL